MKYFDREMWFICIVAVIFVGAAIIGLVQIHDAIVCSNKGGMYLTGRGIWPVCINAEVIK